MAEKDIQRLREDLTNLEEYTPILNERIATNELAIQSLEARIEENLNKPSADVSEFD